MPQGRPSPTGVLLIPGFMGTPADWDFLTKVLSKNHYCLILNLTGEDQAFSELKALPPWPATLVQGMALARTNLEKLTASIKDFAQAKGIKFWQILGYSLGGRLAALLAIPLQAQVLIMESASFGLEGKEKREERAIKDRIWYEAIKKNWGKTLIRDWYRQGVFCGIDKDKKMFEGLIKSRLQLAKPQVLKQLILYSQAFLPKVSSNELANPYIYLLAGGLDVKYSRLVKKWGGGRERISVKIKDNASHNVHLSNPNWYIKTVSSILKNPNKLTGLDDEQV